MSALFGEQVTGDVLLAVSDRWAAELLAMLPQARRHAGDVHFTATPEGEGERIGSVELLVVDPAVARLEALRPVLVRGGALATVGEDGTVRCGRGPGPLRPIGRLGGGRA